MDWQTHGNNIFLMKKLIIHIIILTFCFAMHSYAQMSPQSKTITAKYFPDPDIQIYTPAFQKKKGFTNYEEMMRFLNGLMVQHGNLMTLNYIGTSQKGKEIPQVTLSKRNGNEKLRVWIQGGLHGNEPASTEGVLYLLYELLTNAEYTHLLNKLDITLVPMANIDGYEKQDRYAHNGLDLNRDQTKLHAQESIYLKQAFNHFNPHIGLDIHEYKPYRKSFTQLSTFGVTNGYDVMFLYSGNLNVPEELREFTHQTFVQPARNVLDTFGLTHHDYFSDAKVNGQLQFNQGSISARSSATSYALANCISTLVEVRGVDLGRTSYKRRVHSVLLVCASYLQSAYNNSEEVTQVLQQSEKSASQAVVKMKSKVSEQAVTLIDIATENKIDINVNVRNAWYSTATSSRTRPTAYIILANETHVIKKLAVLGLAIDTLRHETQAIAEAYTITEYKQDNMVYEGSKRQTVETLVEEKNLTLPAGTFVIYLNQPRANLAIEVLEPEAPNSFVTFDVLHTRQGAELPIYRYLKNQAL